MENTDSFVKEHNEKKVDFDGKYGCQCVDLAEYYNKEVVGGTPFHCNACDIQSKFDRSKYEWISHKPGLFPLKGDVVVWAKSPALETGHVGIALLGTALSFQSFDQNWPYGSPAKVVLHPNYVDVAGWLRPLQISESATPRELPRILV